ARGGGRGGPASSSPGGSGVAGLGAGAPRRHAGASGPRVLGPPVRAPQHSGTTAGAGGVPGLGEPTAHLRTEPVVLAARIDTGRTEDTDGGRNLRQQAEALDELRLDAQDPPGVGVHPVGGTTVVQEPLVGGGPGDGAPPVGQGSRSSYSFFILHALKAIRIAPAHT